MLGIENPRARWRTIEPGTDPGVSRKQFEAAFRGHGQHRATASRRPPVVEKVKKVRIVT